MPPECSQCESHAQVQELSRQRIRETIENVVYVEQRIKKFNREGSENMEVIRIPEFEEQLVEVDIVEYNCSQCGYSFTQRENEVVMED